MNDTNPAAVSEIDMTEILAESCTAQLGARVFNRLRDHYLDLTPEQIGHAVSETLSVIAGALQAGDILSLEGIGELIPAQVGGRRCIKFIPAPALLAPQRVGGRPLVQLADRRATIQETTTQ